MRITALIALLLLPGAWSKAGDGEDLPTDAPLRIGIKKRIPADECVKAHKGQKLKMHYRGTLYADGEEFDSSYGRDEPFEFTLGQSEVIAGWDQGEKIENLTVEHGVSLVWLLGRALKKTDPAAVGLLLKRRNPQTIAPPTPARARAGLVGMCKGEQRKLTIPSDLGYGSAGSPPSIPGYVVRCGAAARGGGVLVVVVRHRSRSACRRGFAPCETWGLGSQERERTRSGPGAACLLACWAAVRITGVRVL